MVKSALLLRAIEDVKRIWRIRDDKSAITSLHQRGLLGDDTKSRFEFAEKELEAEILDVVQEANSFKQGWGTLIFATATEMAQAERTRETVLNIPKIRMREGEFPRSSYHIPHALPAIALAFLFFFRLPLLSCERIRHQRELLTARKTPSSPKEIPTRINPSSTYNPGSDPSCPNRPYSTHFYTSEGQSSPKFSICLRKQYPRRH